MKIFSRLICLFRGHIMADNKYCLRCSTVVFGPPGPRPSPQPRPRIGPLNPVSAAASAGNIAVVNDALVKNQKP
jgi:hypothetical protein